MDKEQIKVAEAHGYHISDVPGLARTPWLDFYKADKNGVVIKHHLPADPYSMGHYLSKGFSLQPPAAPVPVPPTQTVYEAPVQVIEPEVKVKVKRKYRKHKVT